MVFLLREITPFTHNEVNDASLYVVVAITSVRKLYHVPIFTQVEVYVKGTKIEMMRGIHGFIVDDVTHDSVRTFTDENINVKFYRIGYMWQAVHLMDFEVYIYWDYGDYLQKKPTYLY